MLIYLSTCCLTCLAGIRAQGGQQTAAVGALWPCWWTEAALLPISLLGVSVTLPSTWRAAWLLLPKGSVGSGGKGSRLGQEGRRSLPFLVDSNPLQAWVIRPKRTLRTLSVPISKQPLPAFKKPRSPPSQVLLLTGAENS